MSTTCILSKLIMEIKKTKSKNSSLLQVWVEYEKKNLQCTLNLQILSDSQTKLVASVCFQSSQQPYIANRLRTDNYLVCSIKNVS